MFIVQSKDVQLHTVEQRKCHQTVKRLFCVEQQPATPCWAFSVISAILIVACYLPCSYSDSSYNPKHTLNLISNILSSLIIIDNDTAFFAIRIYSLFVFLASSCYHTTLSRWIPAFFLLSSHSTTLVPCECMFALFTLVCVCLLFCKHCARLL